MLTNVEFSRGEILHYFQILISSNEAGSAIDFYYSNTNQSLKNDGKEFITEASSPKSANTEANFSLSLYPNPASDKLLVILTGHIPEEQSYTIVFYDMLGRIRFNQSAVVNTTELDVSLFPSGVYKAILFLQEEIISTKKVFVVH